MSYRTLTPLSMGSIGGRQRFLGFWAILYSGDGRAQTPLRPAPAQATLHVSPATIALFNCEPIIGEQCRSVQNNQGVGSDPAHDFAAGAAE